MQIRTIELLKIRFGETALSVCDVMLKDMADSKRIDDHVHGDIQVGLNRCAIIGYDLASDGRAMSIL